MYIIATNKIENNHFHKIPFQNLPIESSSKLDYRVNIDNIFSAKHEYGVNSFLQTIKAIEDRFHNAPNRSKRYYSKGKKKRTILTLLGEITFERTYYQDRTTGKCFFYVDLCLKLDKYRSIDPYLEAMILDECSKSSMAESGRNIARLINRNVNDVNINISRQTVRNIVLKNDFDYIHKETTTPNVVNIMLDEKWVPLQRENQSKLMCKCAVIYEDRRRLSKNRTELLGKTVVMGGKGFNNRLLDTLYNKYDMEKINEINIIGDGATWIKCMPNNLHSSNITINSYLDKFHFRKTINNITKDKSLQNILVEYTINNDKILFNELVNKLILHQPNRAEILNSYLTYINNNFKNIHSTYKLNIPCSMEGHISHNIASHLARNPKGYSIKTLNKLITLREAKLNNIDIIKEILIQKKNNRNPTPLDFSMFETKDTYSIANIKLIIN